MPFQIPVNKVKAASHTVKQGVTNKGTQAKSGPPPHSVDQILLKQSQWLLLSHHSRVITTDTP